MPMQLPERDAKAPVDREQLEPRNRPPRSQEGGEVQRVEGAQARQTLTSSGPARPSSC